MPKKGYKHTEEAKKKMSEIAKSNRKGKVSNAKGKHWKLSEETKKKIGKANKGKNCHFWKGGISLLRNVIYHSFEYRQWRSDIFTRDNFTCQECGERGGKINSHHIKSFAEILREYQIKTFEEATNCEALWNINNGKTLCIRCHKLTDNYANRKSKN